MRTLTKHIALLCLLLLAGATAWAQGGRDERAEELTSLAKKYYNTRSYFDAATTFDLATQRPQNDLSTYCMYMTGLSYYKAGDLVKAGNAFSRFITKHSDSKYIEDARYHRAIVWLQSEHVTDREKGLDDMIKLHGQTKDAELKRNAESAVRHFTTNVFELPMLEVYLKFAEKSYQAWIVEAICLQLDRKGDGYQLLSKLSNYQAAAGTMSPLLNDLQRKYSSGKVNSGDRMRVAIMLSFNLQYADTARAVPAKSEKAVEMLEGMMLALDSLGGRVGKQVLVKVIDTRGDTTLLPRLLDSLQAFNPDVVIGDIKTGLATGISDWAEKNKVVHLIPRNPLTELVDNKKFTFLLHPSLAVHGAQMARYLVDKEGKRRLMVFNDKTYYTERFARGFKAALANDAGVTVTEKTLPSRYSELQPRLSSELHAMKGAGYDGVYAPLTNEESAGLLMAKLNYDNIKLQVAGGPDWETFSVIDQELKTSYGLSYSSFYYEANDSIAFEGLYRRCLQKYAYRPSMYTVQGYDIMMWLLTVSQGVNGSNGLADVIHKAENYHGIHQDFYYGPAQDNQRINILKYINGRLHKVN